MSTSQKLSRMVCTKCGHIFDIGEAAIEYSKYYGISIPNKVCPQCGGGFRMIEIPKDFDQYLYVDNDERYYSYGDDKRR